MTVGLPHFPPSPEGKPPRRSRTLVVVALVLLVAGGAGAAWWQTRKTSTAANEPASPRVAALDDTTARAPANTRVRVRVVNISGITGLARRTTRHLRAYGFDVVDFLSSETEKNAVTRIAVHTGHDDWGQRVQKAMGLGTVTAAPDSLRYADLTVFVGRDWRPPAEALRP
jgi:LytR cell envelope-related transcriptional attenuator